MLQKTAIEPGTLELLKKLQADPMLSGFHLAGGTGLALQIGHRLSVDLELFSFTSFDNDFYHDYLQSEYSFESDFTAPGTLKGSIDGIKVDIIAHVYTILYPLVELEEVRLYSCADIAAMKVNAISGSGTRSKDYVDLYFLLKQFQLGEIIGFYEAKYTKRNTFHALKSLNYFNDADISDWPVLLKNKSLKWKDIMSFIDKQCKEYIIELNKYC